MGSLYLYGLYSVSQGWTGVASAAPGLPPTPTSDLLHQGVLGLPPRPRDLVKGIQDCLRKL